MTLAKLTATNHKNLEKFQAFLDCFNAILCALHILSILLISQSSTTTNPKMLCALHHRFSANLLYYRSWQSCKSHGLHPQKFQEMVNALRHLAICALHYTDIEHAVNLMASNYKAKTRKGLKLCLIIQHDSSILLILFNSRPPNTEQTECNTPLFPVRILLSPTCTMLPCMQGTNWRQEKPVKPTAATLETIGTGY